MSKKNIFTNPYRDGDEDHLYFTDEKMLKHFASSLAMVEKYFRYTMVGFNNFPPKKGFMIVANHGFMPFDMALLIRQIYLKTGRRVRMLMHSRTWRLPVLREVFLNMGAVDATPENAVRLLKRGEIVAVFPGGEREGLRSSAHKYKLLWEGRTGFAKTAIAAGVPVVPCMSVGIDDIFYILDQPMKISKKLFHRYLPFPFFVGLGGLPFPRKITTHIGVPIQPPKSSKMVTRFHQQVWASSQKMLQEGVKKRRWFE
ncbi:acyltransferase family protein [bacterium]|nr:acyltransferase family protein [bacterium]